MAKYTSIDLFAGPGGLATGMKWAGVKALIAVEWSYWTVQTYATSHNAEIFELAKYMDGTMESPERFFQPSDRTLLIYGDVNLVTKEFILKALKSRYGVETVDIVTGGAPCESFSLAGQRKEDDNRNELYQNVLRIARAVDSKMFLFENVEGLFSKRRYGVKGAMYESVIGHLEEQRDGEPNFKLASTDKDEVLLYAPDYGVPQERKRLFLVGINTKYPNGKFTYPEPTHGEGRKFRMLTVEDAIMDLPQVDINETADSYEPAVELTRMDESRADFVQRMREGLTTELYNHVPPNHTANMRLRLENIRPGENMRTSAERLKTEGKTDIVEKVYPKVIYPQRNRKLRLDRPSYTITSHCLDELVHPTLARGLTPREVARLQSFPDWYQFKGPQTKWHGDPQQDQYEQVGDAIPPLLGYALGKQVAKTLLCIQKTEKRRG